MGTSGRETIWGRVPTTRRRRRPTSRGAAPHVASAASAASAALARAAAATPVSALDAPDASAAAIRELDAPVASAPVRARRRAKRVPRQLSFAEVVVRTHGGARAGAGRKRKDPAARPNVVHRTRPLHEREMPVHITLRRTKSLPSLRAERVHRVVKSAIARTRRNGFRITHYSIQRDHVHFVIEADDPTSLSNGMRSLAVRIAMRVNRQVLGRTRGHVWGDRYHRRDLTSPREVRNVLVYVLANHLKHGEVDVGLLDPCSSGPWFTGWVDPLERPPDASPVVAATTWVLRGGWITRGGGRIRLGEVPRALRA